MLKENTNIQPLTLNGPSGSNTAISRRSRRAFANSEVPISQDLSSEIQDPSETDSTELVVELAQGQRLILRGIQPGVMIEVAAWTGTDSPGDNTVRMLFGAGKAKTEQADTQESGQGNPDKRITALENSNQEPKLLYEVDQQSENYRETSEQKKLRRKRMRRGIFWVLGVIGVISAILFGLSTFNLVQFVHPTSGLTNTLGSADTAIAVVGPSVDLEQEASIVFHDGPNNVLGGVITVEEGKVLVYTGQGQTVVARDLVIGRVLFVVPFLGVIAGLLGL